MSGKPAGNWMDSESGGDTSLSQSAGEFGDRKLRLCNSHSVARGDDHRRRLEQHVGHIGGAALAVFTVFGLIGGDCDGPEATGDHRDE